jgi:hypothetical protein
MRLHNFRLVTFSEWWHGTRPIAPPPSLCRLLEQCVSTSEFVWLVNSSERDGTYGGAKVKRKKDRKIMHISNPLQSNGCYFLQKAYFYWFQRAVYCDDVKPCEMRYTLSTSLQRLARFGFVPTWSPMQLPDWLCLDFEALYDCWFGLVLTWWGDASCSHLCSFQRRVRRLRTRPSSSLLDCLFSWKITVAHVSPSVNWSRIANRRVLEKIIHVWEFREKRNNNMIGLIIW